MKVTPTIAAPVIISGRASIRSSSQPTKKVVIPSAAAKMVNISEICARVP